MSVFLTAFLLGLGAAALSGATVRVLGGWGRKRLAAKSAEIPAPALVEEKRLTSMLAEFRLKPGAVISVSRTEIWLEHGWLLREANEAVALVLFGREATVIVLPAPSSALFLLNEVALDWPAEPPPSVDVAALRYERARRVPVDIQALADSPEPPSQDGLLTEYRALNGDVLWALGRRGAFKAWSGRRVDESELELWG